MAKTHVLILTLITISILSIAAEASPPHDSQILDVSGSLNRARQVFASPDLSQQLQVPAVTTAAGGSGSGVSSSTLSVTIHPRASLHGELSSHRNNYTSLTLSRLARDAARVRSILAKHSVPLDGDRFRPEQFTAPLTSGVAQGSGEYFARIGVGQPVKDTYMVIDTGSDVSWLQCQPCSDCYEQTNAIFNPTASSTYKALSCTSQQCNSLQVSACRTNACLYQVSYGDGSYTVGEFATETVSFGSTGSVPNVAVGCGHDNEGLFHGADGLLGLGGGSLSLPSQIKATSLSYCLVNRDSQSSSTLEFNSAPPGDSVIAPMLTNSRINTFRYVALTGVLVGGRPVNIPASVFEIGGDGRGGVIVDSGTAITRFRSEIYNPMRDAFVRLTRDLPRSSGFALFDTCYDLSSMSTARVPTVALQFAGGKTLPLRATNYLIPVDNPGKFCFAFAGEQGQLSIIGNVQQQGTRVSYNLADKSIGFSPNKC